MSVAAKRKQQGVMSMPVKELPMPPVKIQKQDFGGGIATYRPSDKDAPVPQLANIKLNIG